MLRRFARRLGSVKATEAVIRPSERNVAMLNFGPVHPGAHGVLRLILGVAGEQIVRTDPHIGYLHRGTEKLMETKPVTQLIPYMDRLDYVSPLTMEQAFVIAVEDLLGIEPPTRAQQIRVITAEATRIMNHWLALGCHAGDVGALSPLLWAFEERDKLLDLIEELAGSRLHANYFRPGGVRGDVTDAWLEDMYTFVRQTCARFDEISTMLDDNLVWRARLMGVGRLSLSEALSLGCSGPVLRSCGIPWDLRQIDPYDGYENYSFAVPFGVTGDSYDRYLVRVEEMRQSSRIINEVLNSMVMGPINHPKTFPNPDLMESMQGAINHFKFYSEGYTLPTGMVYRGIESTKGEFGIFLVGNDSPWPYRCHIRSPGFHHLNAMRSMADGHQIADIATLLGTVDVVFGEVDR